MPQGNPVWRADLAAREAVHDSVAAVPRAAHDIATFGNWWGGPGVILFAAALWLGARAFGRREIARVGLRGAEALAIASAISGVVKGFAGRARPYVDAHEPWRWEFNHGWTDARFFSMPSGHTTATVACLMAIIAATAAWRPAARAGIGGPLALGAIIVAWARIYSDQHWLSDVMAGAALGWITAAVLARAHAGRGPSRYDRLMLGASAGDDRTAG